MYIIDFILEKILKRKKSIIILLDEYLRVDMDMEKLNELKLFYNKFSREFLYIKSLGDYTVKYNYTFCVNFTYNIEISNSIGDLIFCVRYKPMLITEELNIADIIPESEIRKLILDSYKK